MDGARKEVTRPMRLIPPMITMATTAAKISAVATRGTPKAPSICTAMVLLWFMLPLPKEQMAARPAKVMAIHFQFFPRPSSM